MAITDKVYVKDHGRLRSALGASFPKAAFSGATLDVLFTGDLEGMDDATRDRVLEFTADFLDCTCDANPYCGCPEETFVSYLLELRATGLGPEGIVDAMTADYMVYAYPGDVLSFLDDAVRTLEAAEAVADVTGEREAAASLRARRREIEG